MARTAGRHVPPERETQKTGRKHPSHGPNAHPRHRAGSRVLSASHARPTVSAQPPPVISPPGSRGQTVPVPACLPAEVSPQGPPFHLLPCDGNRVQTDPTVPQPPFELHFLERSTRHFRQEVLVFSIFHLLCATQTAGYCLSL